MAKKLVGIGGWLILLTIQLVLFALLYGLITLFPSVGNYSHLKNSYIAFIATGIMAVLSLYSLILMKQKKKLFTRITMITLWYHPIMSYILSVIFLPTKTVFTGQFASIIWAIIWTLYFIKSIRVKNTFVN